MSTKSAPNPLASNNSMRSNTTHPAPVSVPAPSTASLLASSHFIFLIQSTLAPSSRIYSEYSTLSAGLDSILSEFESQLKSKKPHQERITYSVEEFFSYLDSLQDCVALEFDGQLIAYIPRNKEWIKEKSLNHLKKQAGML